MERFSLLPGCSASKGLESETFKMLMNNYFVDFETVDQVQKQEGRTLYVTHTLPRRVSRLARRARQKGTTKFWPRLMIIPSTSERVARRPSEREASLNLNGSFGILIVISEPTEVA